MTATLGRCLVSRMPVASLTGHAGLGLMQVHFRLLPLAFLTVWSVVAAPQSCCIPRTVELGWDGYLAPHAGSKSHGLGGRVQDTCSMSCPQVVRSAGRGVPAARDKLSEFPCQLHVHQGPRPQQELARTKACSRTCPHSRFPLYLSSLSSVLVLNQQRTHTRRAAPWGPSHHGSRCLVILVSPSHFV
jgi:hypothetical protein